MNNVISIATSAADYETGFVVRRLAEMVAHKNPGKRILTIHKHYDTDQKEAIYEYIYPFNDVPVYPDIHEPGIYSLYLDAYFKMSNMHPDLAIYIVKSLAEKYDLVICDAGNQIEDAFALGSMFESKETYYVLDHTLDSVKRLAWLKPLLDKLGIQVGGHILDHSDGAEYSYYEYTQTLGLRSMDDTYMIDADREHDELNILASSVSSDQFKQEKASDFEERGDR